MPPPPSSSKSAPAPASPAPCPPSSARFLIDRYFTGPHAKYRLTQHHLQSYSDCIRSKIPTILQDFNGLSASEVYTTSTSQEGAGAERHDDTGRRGGGDAVHARLHFFVGLDLRDLHEYLHGAGRGREGARETTPSPTRIHARNQVLEYTQHTHQPRRLITPNEARLRNLNYQLELVATVIAVHHDHMTAHDRDRYGKDAEAFLMYCVGQWHEMYVKVRGRLVTATSDIEATGGRGGGKQGADEESSASGSAPPRTRVKRAGGTDDAWSQACVAATKTIVGDGGEAEGLLSSQVALWARRVLASGATYADALNAVAQRVAAARCPYVTLYDDVVLTKLPLMLHSPFCVLRDQADDALRDMGECPYEKGGYFVVRGKEKVIISQEDYQRNVIQTRATTVPAPPSHVPERTWVLNRTTSPEDTEELFEAQINCSDDPRPPVLVKLQYKRLYQYMRGDEMEDDGAELPWGDDDHADNHDDDRDNEGKRRRERSRRRDAVRSRRFLNFKGLYVTLNNRKGVPIVQDLPLMVLFRAMGATNPTAAQSTEQLSDREILECILGVNTATAEEVYVPGAALIACCGVRDIREVRPGQTVWYTPRGDGDCAWVSADRAPVGEAWAAEVGSRVRVQAVRAGASGLSVTCEVVEAHGGHLKVRLVSEATHAQWKAWQAHTAFLGPPVKVRVTVRVKEREGSEGAAARPARLVPCRYERRHRATITGVTGGTDAHVVLAYTTHTSATHAIDPLAYDILLPSLAEGSFAPTTAIARDLLDRQIQTDALRDQVRTLRDADTASSKHRDRRRRAFFNLLFTHLDTGAVEHAALRYKQFFLGHMTKRLLYAYMGLRERNTSRDSYELRRVKSSGEMIAEVFRYEYFQLGNTLREYVATGMRQQGNAPDFRVLLAPSVVRTNLFNATQLTDRLQKSFMGNWGSKEAADADQKAYCQELIRLSFFGSLSYLRRVHKELPSTSSPGQKKGRSKATVPRMLHGSEYGLICPVETPDGGNIGKIKHLTTFAFVAPEMPPTDRDRLTRYVAQYAVPLHQVDRFYALEDYHKVIIDGSWTYVCREAATETAAVTATETSTDGRWPTGPMWRRGKGKGNGDDLLHAAATPLPPHAFVDLLRLFRRNGLLSPLVSIAWNIADKEIVLTTQAGRVLRPLLVVEHGILRFSHGFHDRARDPWSWSELLSGRGVGPGRTPATYHDLGVKYDSPAGWRAKAPACDSQPFAATVDALRRMAGVLEYLDCAETNTRLVCVTPARLCPREGLWAALQALGHAGRGLEAVPGVGFMHPARRSPTTAFVAHDTREIHRARVECTPSHDGATVRPRDGVTVQQRYNYTHCEIHPSLMLGVLGMLTPFSEHNPAPRNLYSAHQSKQALGIYVSNFRKRMDHANHILHHPERPLVGSRYAQYFNRERLNYGTNVVVAIMCVSGFNIEDALILNRQSVARGLFQSTYFFTEEISEKDTPNEKVTVGRHPTTVRDPRAFHYDKVDAHPEQLGVLPGTFVDAEVRKGDVLIEAYEETREAGAEGTRAITDHTRVAKSDGAYVEQVYLSDQARGRRVAKVTLRKVRVPAIGDKFASRAAQKGTLGLLMDETDMPFVTSSPSSSVAAAETYVGMRPDVILNPHALPSRMTIGQLLEMLSGVLGCHLGRHVDATPLCSTIHHGARGSPSDSLCAAMGKVGLDPHGDVTMCDGTTGETAAARVFVGPTYYQRLKQMTVDKVYSRSRGREDLVTRQPVAGRAQGGALKFGEMERDSLLAHGIGGFMKEAWTEKSDAFHYDVDVRTGDVEAPTHKDKVDLTRYTPVRTGTAHLNDDDGGGWRAYLPHDATNVSRTLAHAEVVDRERRPTNRDTARVHVPFAMRLLTMECEAMGMGVHMETGRKYGDEGWVRMFDQNTTTE